MVNAYLVFEAYLIADEVYIDKKWLADPVNHTWILKVKNQSNQTLYFKLFNAILNWDFGTSLPGTDEKELGAVGAGSSISPLIDMVREVPVSEILDDGNLTLKAYTDPGYSNEIASADLYVTIDIQDIENWTDVTIYDFNDGTAQGWTLEGFSVSDVKSVEAGGYSLGGYCKRTANPCWISRTITIPNRNKCSLSFFITTAYPSRLLDISVYVDGTLVFNYPNVFGSGVATTWAKISVNLSPYKGLTKTIKIFPICNTDSDPLSPFIDRIVVAGKD